MQQASESPASHTPETRTGGLQMRPSYRTVETGADASNALVLLIATLGMTGPFTLDWLIEIAEWKIWER